MAVGPQRWSVVGDDDELRLALAQSLERLSVAEHVLTALHDQRQPRVDALYRLFLQQHARYTTE